MFPDLIFLAIFTPIIANPIPVFPDVASIIVFPSFYAAGRIGSFNFSVNINIVDRIENLVIIQNAITQTFFEFSLVLHIKNLSLQRYYKKPERL
jgi:hypothetical protein